MRHKLILILVVSLTFLTCKNQPNHLTKIEAENIDITDSLESISSIDDFCQNTEEII